MCMSIKDMRQVVKLFENEWSLGEVECGASRHLCAWIYLMEILESTEKSICYRENNRLLGFASYSNTKSKKHILRKRMYAFFKKLLHKSKEIKDLEALIEYEGSYKYSPEEFQNYFDGEVLMLIIDKGARGKGLGTKLLEELFELAKKDNMKNLQILTDESCNYSIYESLGCKKIYEGMVENKSYENKDSVFSEKVYIFEKRL